jgi:two-component system chemotaxis sensor kinase CheA
MVDVGDKAREEFFSEAQEIVEGLSRDLLALDDGSRRGPPDPELVNNVFRAVHTLKGLAGLFGAGRISALSHELENLLDELRLGKVDLTPGVLDLLFRAVELYGRMLAVETGARHDPLSEVEDFIVELGRASAKGPSGGGNPLASYDIDPGILAVLTEYEEHRLRTNVQQGLGLFRLRVVFQLLTIDEELNSLKARAKPHGEIITYLPTGQGADADSIELDILMASRDGVDRLRASLGAPNIRVEEVSRRLATVMPGPLVAEAGAAPAKLAELDSIAPPPLPSESRAEVAKKREAAAMEAMSIRSVAQTVRVDIRKLDRLMNIVGELAIVRNALSRLTERVREAPEMRELGLELYRMHRGFERHLAEMQSGILEVRMVPLGQLFDKLGRVVRQISRDAGKEVNLVITGGETEVDKLIVEELSDPLMHMMRNAVDHGIEPRADREAVGKPAVGTIALNAFQKGSHVVIEIEDDGAGIDEAKLLASAIKRGVLDDQQTGELGRREILNLIFVPGLSTKDEAGELSGRGVGMDVVKTNIAKLGGIVDVYSELGIGTKLTVTLPITLAIISALVVKVAGRTFAIPVSSVQEAIALDSGIGRRLEGREVMTLRGTTLPLCRLGELFGFESLGTTQRGGRQFAVVAGVGARRLGLVVDELIGQQDIVIKPLGASLSSVRGFAGATELGDQRVALVIDAPALIEEMAGAAEAARMGAPRHG